MAKSKSKAQRKARLARSGGWVCGQEALPADFGKISMEPDPNFRPLTAKDWEGFSEEDWKQIIASEQERTPNDQAQLPARERA